MRADQADTTKLLHIFFFLFVQFKHYNTVYMVLWRFKKNNNFYLISTMDNGDHRVGFLLVMNQHRVIRLGLGVGTTLSLSLYGVYVHLPALFLSPSAIVAAE